MFYKNILTTVGMAKVATSVYEGFDLGFTKGRDIVVVNKDRQIQALKQVALQNGGTRLYTTPARKDIKVLGKQALGMFLVGTDQMEAGKYISEHDKKSLTN